MSNGSPTSNRVYERTRAAANTALRRAHPVEWAQLRARIAHETAEQTTGLRWQSRANTVESRARAELKARYPQEWSRHQQEARTALTEEN